MGIRTGTDPWHAVGVSDVIARLDTDEENGLDAAEAARRLERFGPNALSGGGGPTRITLLLGQFQDVLVWLLLVAALVSGVLLREWVDAAVIGAIALLNAVLGYAQEATSRERPCPVASIHSPQ